MASVVPGDRRVVICITLHWRGGMGTKRQALPRENDAACYA